MDISKSIRMQKCIVSISASYQNIDEQGATAFIMEESRTGFAKHCFNIRRLDGTAKRACAVEPRFQQLNKEFYIGL